MEDGKEQFDRGRFEGQVLARLDSIVASIAEINVVFIKHSDADKSEFAILHKRIDELERVRWLAYGVVVVIGIVFQLIAPRLITLVHLSN